MAAHHSHKETPPLHSASLSERIRVVPSKDVTEPSKDISESSAEYLLRSLLNALQEVETCRRPRPSPARATAFVTRKIRLLSLVVEDVHENIDGASAADPQVTAWLRDVLEAIEKSAALLREKSRLWIVLNCDRVSDKWEAIEQELGRSLQNMPVAKLNLSEDVREMVGLLIRRPRRSSGRVFEDSGHEWRLRKELLSLIRSFDNKRPPADDVLRQTLHRLGVRNAADCRDEDRKLRDELAAIAANCESGSETAQAVNSLISLIAYVERILFSEEGAEGGSPREGRVGVASGDMPREFRCPISRSLMRDPVVTDTGETFERRFIESWLLSGAAKGSHMFASTELVPNYALKGCIQQWCNENFIDFDVDEETCNASLDGPRTADFLVGKLATGSAEIQTQAAGELRLLAKSGSLNRLHIAEAGAVPFLVDLLSTRHEDAAAQENAVTALLNLSIYEKNKRLIAGADGALDAIIGVVSNGATMVARENAAAALYVVSAADDECRAAVAQRPGAVQALLRLLAEGTPQAKKDAATALLNLGLYRPNKAVLAAAGAVPVVVEVLAKAAAAEIKEDAVGILASVAECPEGVRAVVEDPTAVAVVVGVMASCSWSERIQEACCGLLCGLCKVGGDMGLRALADVAPQCVPLLQSLASGGPPGARRKAAAVLKFVNAASKLSCFCAY